jgi:MYXO-CTERM domain-containing protein
MRMQSYAVACVCALSLLARAHLAHAEGSAELGTVQGLDSATEVLVEILDPQNENIHWDGPFPALPIRLPDGTPTAILAGQSIAADQGGVYRVTLPGDIAAGVAWDLSVRTRDAGEERPGRVFARQWTLDAVDSTAAGGLSARFYARVPAGGQRAVVELRLDGASSNDGSATDYAIQANATGLSDPGRSVPGSGGTIQPGNLDLFLAPPEDASYSVPAPRASNLAFRTGSQGSCSVVIPGQPGGNFLFVSDVAGNYQLFCDLNGGGFDITDDGDLLLLGAVQPGVNQVPWDGTTRDSEPIPAGSYDCQVRVTVGELHFIADDVETMLPGLRMFALAADGTPDALSMYWNDSRVQADGPDRTSGPDGLSSGDPAAPAEPGVNARAWGDFSAGGKGNEALLDTFAWIADSTSATVQIPAAVEGQDTDGDGIDDLDELCDLGTGFDDADSDDDGRRDDQELLTDTDGDGLIDALDPDSDNDGLLDGTEAGVTTPGPDTDVSRGNFIPDADPTPTRATSPTDPDSDDGGIIDGNEDFNRNGRIDDADGELDPRQFGDDIGIIPGAPAPAPDTDGDGLVDPSEEFVGSNPNDADTDDDGLIDSDEPNWNTDTDGDGLLNVFDPDSDNDGIFDGTEAGVTEATRHENTNVSAGVFVPDADPSTTTFVVVADSDRGGVRDGGEDPDHDGRIDAGELDPRDTGDDITPPIDSDSDGLTDAEEDLFGTDPEDADTDDDGVRDGDEPNWNQDSDGDVLRNAEDADSDNDGVFDGTEAGVTTPDGDTFAGAGSFIPDADPTTTTNPLFVDTDEGGRRDGTEDENHNGRIDAGEHDPLDPADDQEPVVDADQDGLTDIEEMTFGSNPLDADSDDDGVIDGSEINWAEDTDNDGIRNVLDFDSDNDGPFDGTELGVTEETRHPDTNVNAGVFRADAGRPATTSPVAGDTDRGGVRDGAEDSNHNGKIDALETDPNDPADDGQIVDMDGDGLSDYEEEAFGTEVNDADTDDDGLRDGDEPSWNVDFDRDSMINALDADSDGDGLFDGTERGVTTAGPGTTPEPGFFVPDADPTTTTNMLDADSDNGGVRDGLEDANRNGRVDEREIDPNDGADDGLLDQDQDTIIDDQDGNDDADDDGTHNLFDTDADGDTISDEDEAGDLDRLTPAVNTDGDGSPDFLDTDTDGDGVADADEAGDGDLDTPPVDTDSDGTPDFRDTDSDGDGLRDGLDPCRTDPSNTCVSPDDRDGDGILDGVDNCPDQPNMGQLDRDGDRLGDACDPDADGDGFDDDLTVGGGGCSAAGGGSPDSAPSALILLFALALLLRRRRTAAVAALALVVGVVALAPRAEAQEAAEKFSLERFRLASDRDGVLHAESGAVPAHLSWDAALLFGFQSDPLVIYREADGDRERVGALVSQRISGSLIGSIALWNRLALAIELPVILSQDEDAAAGASVASLAGAGIGDLRIAPKLQVLDAARSGMNLALLASVYVPTGSGGDDQNAFWGEQRVAFAPEAAVSRTAGAWRLAGNIGYLARKNAELADLSVINELYLRLGAGYDFAARGGAPIEVDLGLSAATAAARPLSDYNRNHLELLAGVAYDLPGPLSAALGGGLGLNEGFGTPDWRVLLAVRASGRPDPDPDGDGIFGDADGCPDEPEDKDAFQDEDGCPELDNDADGVADASDGAPNEPEDKDDFKDEDGVPELDNDEDGLPDTEEACPNEPENKNEYQDDDGCPDTLPDSDGDGLVDRVDECPEQPEDMDSFQDEDGCPDDDNDDDGVADATDGCVNEYGPAENRGCPDTDRDNDTVVDRLDNCPDEPGPPANQGCKRRQRVRLAATKLEILETVFFQNNRAGIQRRSHALLRDVAQVLNAHPEIQHVRVEGHSDDRGNDTYNLQLSQRRADEVVAFLVKQGVAKERLEAIGYGETKPLVLNDSKKNRAINRRVEFNIVANQEAPAADAADSAAPEAGTAAPEPPASDKPAEPPAGDKPAPKAAEPPATDKAAPKAGKKAGAKPNGN